MDDSDVGSGSLQFQVQCWAQGHRVPMSASRLIHFTHGKVEGPVPSAPCQTRVGPDWVSSSEKLSDQL